MSKLDINNNPKIQSEYIRLEATGSTANDNTIFGHHLRWDFRKSLGENHIARGGLNESYPSILLMNESNEDYVKIFKTPFSKKYYINIDFSINPEEIIDGSTREWVYNLEVDELGTSRIVNVRFNNVSVYDQIRESQENFNAINFLSQYPGTIEISIENNLFFFYEFVSNFQNNCMIRVETISNYDSSNTNKKQLSSRKKILSNGTEVTSENIRTLRFDCVGAIPSNLFIITYSDFIEGVNNEGEEGIGNWSSVGDFGLTIDSDEAFSRLMENLINNSWPKYIAGPTNELTVKSDNYTYRWVEVLDLIITYLELSQNDPKAFKKLYSSDSTDNSSQTISYLNLIQLLSLDYHLARMFGLGHIVNGEESEGVHIYGMQYKTYCNLENDIYEIDPNNETTHLYLSIPTSQSDHRLPLKPDLKNPTFGISVDNGKKQSSLITDDEGYAKFGKIRYINIIRNKNDFEKSLGTFFMDNEEFNLSDQTQPIAYGIKYKRDSESNYHMPELSHDNSYSDSQNIAETVPILNTGLKIYTHQEKEEGTHNYAVYSINWFSRASSLTQEISVTSSFPKQSHLLPPFNLANQLIQDEDPLETTISQKALILTTSNEQTLLENQINAIGDSILIRVNFDWNQVHHNAHQFADYAELLFRKNEPLVVKGKISNIQEQANNSVLITTDSYFEYSKSVPGNEVIPNISSTDKNKFIGSFLTSGGNNYIIRDITITGNNPTIIVEKDKTIFPFSPDNQNHNNRFISKETFESPNLGELFFIIENTGNEDNWDLFHSKKVYLEKFYTNSNIKIKNTVSNLVNEFNIDSLDTSSGNTEIIVSEEIEYDSIANLEVEYYVKHSILSITTTQIVISGNYAVDFQSNSKFRIFGSSSNDNEYNVANSVYASGQTVITLQSGSSINDISTDTGKSGFIQVQVKRSLININTSNNSFIISGNKESELDIANITYKTESDGTQTRFVNGGIVDTVSFNEIKDDQNNPTGYLEVLFDNYSLVAHSDPDVIWDKGFVRLIDKYGETRPYNVSLIGDKDGNIGSTLTLVIQDPDFIPDTGSGTNYSLDITNSNNANYHPSYKLYLKSDNGIDSDGNQIPTSSTHFDEESILPCSTDFTEGNRKTFIGIRAIDIKNDFKSFISPPSVILAQRISKPEVPGQPVGPKYATRPDFYGKSTYTFDTKVKTEINSEPRIPYSLVFYRGTEELILNTLYKKTTIEQIWSDLENLSYSDAKYDNGLWETLLSVINNGSDFETYTTTEFTFTWPLPDNDEYVIPFEVEGEINTSNFSNKFPNGVIKPFTSSFALNAIYTNYKGEEVLGKEIVQNAIIEAFVPLNDQPPVYSYIKNGKQTSSEKSKLRDTNGNLLDPDSNDLYPMLRKYIDNNETFVRFTDFTIDGASSSMHFYLVKEMSDKLKFSNPSPPIGPILNVNSSLIDKPQIKSAKTILPDSYLGVSAAIQFEVNKYLDSENISKILLYRSLNKTDALSIRSMQLIKSFDINDDIVDNFENDSNPLYGEDLNYRIVAVKEIDEIEDVIHNPIAKKVEIESLPSEPINISLVDSINPEAPNINSSNTVSSSVSREDYLNEVVLKWNSTCYDGKYRLQKLNNKGNWVEFYSVNSKSETMQYPPLDGNGNPDFTNYSETSQLARKDSQGNKIYHRYRVVVENSSGLFNVYQNELSIDTGNNDLARINDFFSFSDKDSLHDLDKLSSVAFDSGHCYPDELNFEFIGFELPAGHNQLQSIEIVIEDDLGNSATKSKTSPSKGDRLVFNSSDGIIVDTSNPNRIYKVTTKIQTDYIDINGNSISPFNQNFVLDYLNGRYNNNWKQFIEIPEPIFKSAISNIEDRIYLIGGFNNGGDGVELIFEINTSESQIKLLGNCEPRIDSKAVAFEDFIFRIGGYIEEPQNMISDLSIYFPMDDEWAESSELPFEARLNAVFTIFEDRLYYGLGEDCEGNIFNDLWEYNIGESIWTQKEDIPIGITKSAFFILHDQIYIIGGLSENGETFECFKFHINEDYWEPIPPLPNPNNAEGIIYSSGFSDNIYGYVCAGITSGSISKDLWRYSPKMDEWCKISDFEGSAVIHNNSSVVINNRAFIIGGLNEDDSINEEIWVIEI